MRIMGIVIAISGPPGSGKSTLASMVAEKLGLRHHSTGSIFRSIAAKRGISVEDLDLVAENDPSIDLEIDGRAKEEAVRGNIVIEGHIATWMVKEHADLLVYVTAPFTTRARRISERDSIDLDEAVRRIRVREESMRRRFKKLYGIDIDDLSIHDIVINTERIDQETMVKIIVTAAQEIMHRRSRHHGGL